MLKVCKICMHEKPATEFRYGRKTCRLCEKAHCHTEKFREGRRAYRQNRVKNASVRDRINQQQCKRHATRMAIDPDYREKRRLIRKEQRRRQHATDSHWLQKQVITMINAMEACNRKHEAEILCEERAKLKVTIHYKRAQLCQRLKEQRCQTERLTDGYIRRKLCHRTILDRKDIPAELISLKRCQMQLSRTIKEMDK